MKSLVQFIKESRVDDSKVEKAIAKVLADKGKDFVKALNNELNSGCSNEDDYENFVMDVMDNPKDYPTRWSLINAVANELKMDPKDLFDNSNSDLFFDYFK